MERLPIQPLEADQAGVVRFRENKIVRYLLDNGGIDMNDIAKQGFPVEDQEQFAQLIGYSLSGFGELSYVTDQTYEAADSMFHEGLSEERARNEHLESVLATVRGAMKAVVPAVFRIHPDDLEDSQ